MTLATDAPRTPSGFMTSLRRLTAITRLSLVELTLPWVRLRPPGGRDWLWLTLLLLLVLSFGHIITASREGVLNRMIDAMLGYQPGSGVPVLVVSNVRKAGTGGAIPQSVFINAGDYRDTFTLFPYREMTSGLGRPRIAFPGQQSETNYSLSDSRIVGWGVDGDHPLLQGAETPLADGKIGLVLNTGVFGASFDLAKYRANLLEKLPPALSAKAAALIDDVGTDLTKLDHLWLEFTFAGANRLVPVPVLWREALPIIEKTAFLFPLRALHLMRAADDLGVPTWAPENDPGVQSVLAQHYGISTQTLEAAFVKSVILYGDLNATEAQMGALAAKMEALLPGSTIRNWGGDLRIEIEGAIPAWLLSAQLEASASEGSGLAPGDWDFTEIRAPWTGYSVGDTSIGIDCALLRKAQGIDASDCNDGDLEYVFADDENGYRRAILYIPDRSDLTPRVESVIQFSEDAIAISPAYQDALRRFDFLTNVIDALRLPFGVTFALLSALLLWIVTASTIEHRLARYAVFLAKGAHFSEIYYMVAFQTVVCTIVGSFLSYGFLAAMAHVVETNVGQASLGFADIILVSEIVVLPISPERHLVIAGLIAALSIGFCWSHLQGNGVKSGKGIFDLVKE